MKRVLMAGLLTAALAAVGCPKPIQWQKYTSKEGRYSIQMPGTPDSKTRQLAGLTMHTDTVGFSNGTYSVSYTDLPTAAPFDLDASVMGTVNGVKGDLIQSKEITGTPGRESSFRIPNKGSGAERVFVFDNRVYQILVLGSNTDIASDDVQKFFTSFKLEK